MSETAEPKEVKEAEGVELTEAEVELLDKIFGLSDKIKNAITQLIQAFGDEREKRAITAERERIWALIPKKIGIADNIITNSYTEGYNEAIDEIIEAIKEA